METLSEQEKDYTDTELARRSIEVPNPGDPGDPDTGRPSG